MRFEHIPDGGEHGNVDEEKQRALSKAFGVEVDLMTPAVETATLPYMLL